MIATLLILGLVLAIVLVLWLLDDDGDQASLDRVRDDLFVADHRIDSEFHEARRAMNDAAGQSWRNLAG